MITLSKVDGNFRITDTMMGFSTTKVMTIDYKPDLLQKRVNKDPWRETTECDRGEFNKYYRDKFPTE